MKTLRDLFLNELADIYDAEKRVAGALETLSKAAAGVHLRRALRSHATTSRGHVTALESVFRLVGSRARGRPCEATVGLLHEVHEILGEFRGSPVIDAAVISAAQKLEHYEIVTYGCLRTWATQLGLAECAQILDQILEEEKASDELLSRLARLRSNQQGLGESDTEGSRPMSGSRVRLATPKRRRRAPA